MNKLYNDTAVQAIANAIRAKNGSSDNYTIAEMSTALNDISYYAKPTIENVPLAIFEADGLPLNSLKVSVEAKQDLHGYDKPWVGGAGKNLIDMQGKYTTSIGMDTLLLPAGEYYVYIFTEGDIGTYNSFTYYSTDGDTFTEINTTDDGVAVCDAKLQYNRKKSHITLHENAYLRQSLQINTGVSGKQIYVMITKDGADYSSIANIPPYSEVDNIWEPYSNICPISGWSEVVVSDVDDVDNPTVTQTTTISLPQTVYGGEVDVVNGILKITDGYIASYNGETLPSTWISSMDVYAEGTTPTTGAEVCYELAEPIIINLTPSLIKSLNGINNLSVDCGDVIELEYFKEV